MKAATVIESVTEAAFILYHVQDKAMLGLEVAILDGPFERS